jgi:hypothetical protein
MTTPAKFAAEYVVPAVRDFRDNRRSRRHAYEACVAVYHLKDHLEACGADVESAFKSCGRNSSFEAIRAACNAYKHAQFPRPNDEQRYKRKYPNHIPFLFGQEYERPPCIAGLAKADLSRVGDRTGGIEIARDRGGFDLYESVKTVLKAYEFHFSFLLEDLDLRSL